MAGILNRVSLALIACMVDMYLRLIQEKLLFFMAPKNICNALPCVFHRMINFKTLIPAKDLVVEIKVLIFALIAAFAFNLQ